MGNKRIEETLTDYFGELLNEPNEPKLTSAAPLKEKAVDDQIKVNETEVGSAPSSSQVQPSETEKETIKSVEAKLIKNKPIENYPAENNPVQKAPTEDTISRKNHDDSVLKSKKDNTINELEGDLKEKSKLSSSPVKEPFVSTTKPSTTNTNKNPLSFDKHPPSSVDESAVSLSQPSASQSSSALGTAAYEQHKQRLERMLQQVTALDSSANTVAPAITPASTTLTSTALTSTTTPATTASPTTESTISTKTDVGEQEQVDVSVEAAAYAMPPLSSEWLDNGRPNWAQEQFDILLIEVNGLQLAVPLVALGQIQDLDEEAMTSLFGQSDWFMGLQKTPMGNVKTVNTAKFVMPERYKDEHNYKYVVSINGLSWGLAVDSIHQPISIDPDSIRWRPKRDSRPWMAGMVKDHMCVLLDIPAMGEILQEQDKNHG